MDIFMAIFICSCHRPSVQWGFCLPFSIWKSNNHSHCNHKSKVKHTFFGLPSWSLAVQNVGIHYAGVHKLPEDVLPCFDWEVANIIFHVHFIMMIYTIHVSVVHLNVWWLIYLDHITTQSPVCMNNISLVWICTDKSYNSIVWPNSGHQVWAAILVWFRSTMDHSARFVNTFWQILLIHSYCPIVVCFTSQQVLWYLNRCKQVVTIDMMIFPDISLHSFITTSYPRPNSAFYCQPRYTSNWCGHAVLVSQCIHTFIPLLIGLTGKYCT